MICVVMPVYNEGEQIYENVQEVHAILEGVGVEHKFLLVNDGSTDSSWQEIGRLQEDLLEHVSAVNFARNFGKEAALCAGAAMASGDAIVTLDADLQHPPELIPEMIRLWQEEGYDVVEAVKAERADQSKVVKVGANVFYRTFSKMTGLGLDQATDFKLLDRKVVEAWKQLDETNTFFRGMTAWVGFKRYELPFTVQKRTSGKSSWSFGGLFKLAVDAITAYTAKPLYAVFLMGLIFLLIAVIIGIQTLVNFIIGSAVTGFTTVILLVLFSSALIMLSLGIVGLYLSKTYAEVKHRPRYIIAEQRGDAFFEE